MLSKKEKLGADQVSRVRDMYLFHAFSKLNGISVTTNNTSKVPSIDRQNNGDKKMAPAEQSINQYSKETAITDTLKLPDIDNMLQNHSLNSTPEPTHDGHQQKKQKGNSMPPNSHNNCKDEVVRLQRIYRSRKLDSTTNNVLSQQRSNSQTKHQQLKLLKQNVKEVANQIRLHR